MIISDMDPNTEFHCKPFNSFRSQVCEEMGIHMFILLFCENSQEGYIHDQHHWGYNTMSVHAQTRKKSYEQIMYSTGKNTKGKEIVSCL